MSADFGYTGIATCKHSSRSHVTSLVYASHFEMNKRGKKAIALIRKL